MKHVLMKTNDIPVLNIHLITDSLGLQNMKLECHDN